MASTVGAWNIGPSVSASAVFFIVWRMACCPSVFIPSLPTGAHLCLSLNTLAPPATHVSHVFCRSASLSSAIVPLTYTPESVSVDRNPSIGIRQSVPLKSEIHWSICFYSCSSSCSNNDYSSSNSSSNNDYSSSSGNPDASSIGGPLYTRSPSTIGAIARIVPYFCVRRRRRTQVTRDAAKANFCASQPNSARGLSSPRESERPARA